MDSVALALFREVRERWPDVYDQILKILVPHSVDAMARVLQYHLMRSVPDLNLFNIHRDKIPHFLLRFVRVTRKNFPLPGDAFGIQLTCRLTKSDTQGTLDSKHMRNGETSSEQFNVDKTLLYEIYIFSNTSQILEMATRRKYATVFVQNYSIPHLFRRLKDFKPGHLERGGPLNKGRDENGEWKYLRSFDFILISDPRGFVKIIYEKQLDVLLRHLELDHILAFSDIRYVFKNCGIASHYFNLRRLVRLQTSVDVDSVQEHDLFTTIKFQCCTGSPLPLNRDGLAKNSERSPLDVWSFEAPKKNLVRFCTMNDGGTRQPVRTSTDKMFFGQQFNEGTGYRFAVMPKTSL